MINAEDYNVFPITKVSGIQKLKATNSEKNFCEQSFRHVKGLAERTKFFSLPACVVICVVVVAVVMGSIVVVGVSGSGEREW